MLSSFVLRLFFGVFFVALHVAGQNSVLTFNWKFKTDAVIQRVAICKALEIVVIPDQKNATAGNFAGVPPYYMMAFPEGGQPITQLITLPNNTQWWTPTLPVGSQFTLQMMDSTGSTGGDGAQIFSIVDNPDGWRDCQAPPPPSDFYLTSNITGGGKLETCHPWRLNINGGTPPYTVILEAKSSPVITNITIPEGNNAVVYINRADPGTTLLAGVVDKNGRWGNGTQWVDTFGTANYACIGFPTVVTTQGELDQDERNREHAKSKHRTTIIIAVVVSIVGTLLVVGVLAAYIRRRRRIAASLAPDIEPRQFMDSGPGGQVLSVTQFMSTSPGSSPSPNKKAFSPISSLPYTIEPFSDDRRGSTADQTQSSSSAADLRNRPSFANFPVSSVRRSGKAREAALDSLADTSQGASSSSTAWPTRSASLQQQHTSLISSAMDNEIIYQHQDAGPGQVVRELPPPYIPPQLQENPGDERSRTVEG